LFVDGENFTIRGQAVAERNGITLAENCLFKRDKFLWFSSPGGTVPDRMGPAQHLLEPFAIRKTYYTSVTGSEEVISGIRQQLRKLVFDPQVFKKTRSEEKAKGVDIALTKDMLCHAFRQNYDIAVLVAGDGDYVPLVEELKRLGKRVHIAFFENDGMNPELKLACDAFQDITPFFIASWKPATTANII